MISDLSNIIPKWLEGKKSSPPPDDLRVHNSDLVLRKGDEQWMDYIWLQVSEQENGCEYSGYRVIRLLQIRSIPVEARADAGLLQKMRTVLRGLSGARVNLAYLVAGIFEKNPLGIVQCYGTVSFAKTLEEAVRQSRRDIAVMEAGLKGQYRQLRLESASAEVAGWIYDSLESFPYALVTVGHPDPRENIRNNDRLAGGNPLIGGQPQQNMTLQQNEILYRGMAALREEFMLMVLGYSVPIEAVTDMLSGYAQEAAIWASQQTGVRSASFGISLPAILTGAMADTASRGYGLSTGTAESEGLAQTEGIANTEGRATTVGKTTSQGWSHTVTVGETTGSSTTNTEGTAQTEGVAHGTSSSSTSGSSSTKSGTSSHTESRSLTGSVNIAPAGVGLTGSYMHGWSDTTMSGWSETSMSRPLPAAARPIQAPKRNRRAWPKAHPKAPRARNPLAHRTR